MERSGNSLSALESALLRAGSQKKMAIELGISEGELSKQIANLRRCLPVIEYLDLELVDVQLNMALRRLLKEVL